jgi:hypothetical protein
MTIRRAVVLSLLAATVGWRSAAAVQILMPPGSTVWIELSSSSCPPDFVGGDCAGSNQAGPAPPNGIPLTTYFDRVTGFAEILPDRVRTYIRNQNSAFMHASFQDTYTVVGTAPGPFDITIQLHVTGSMSSVPAGPFHQLFAGNVQAEIGTFSPLSEIGGAPLNEGFRVTPFPGSVVGDTGPQDLFAPGTIPVDITGSYTKTGVNIGDVFDIGYCVRSAFAVGEIDLRNTGVISFDLPPGVRLISALAQSLVPEPSGLVLVMLAAPCFLMRRR